MGPRNQCFHKPFRDSDAHLSLKSTDPEMSNYRAGIGLLSSKPTALSKLIRTKNWLSLLALQPHCKTQAKPKTVRAKPAQGIGHPFHEPADNCPAFAKDALPYWVLTSPNSEISSSRNPSEAEIPRRSKLSLPNAPRVQRIGFHYGWHPTVVNKFI